MRGHGLLWATPLSAAAIALSELSRVPAEAHRGDLGRLLAALAQLAQSALSQFALSALLLFAVAALAQWETEKRRIRAAAFVVLGIAQSALLREVLIEYHPFAWNLGANVAFVLLALALSLAFWWLASERAELHGRLTAAFGAALALFSLAAIHVHYLVYVGLYPTLHTCVLVASFVGLALGLSLLAAAFAKPRFSRPLALACAAPLVVLAMLDLPSAAWARPYVVAYTELGRAAGVARALEEEGEHLVPRTLPAARSDSLLRRDREAQARFARHSGLPALPVDFDLDRYDVLLVLSDATRFDRTSLARAGGPTPNLAALERRGSMVFTRAYAPSNGTFPSLASMLAMTPLSFAELDLLARFWRGRLRAERTTLPEVMRAAGRSTFWVGHDHDHCFSENIQGLEQGFDSRELVADDLDADERIATLAIDAIRARRDRRYFGLVFFGSPHDDYRAHYPDRPANSDLERYDQELRYVDEQLGRLVEALDRDGRLEETVIIFAGDHGEAFGEHGHRFHLSSLYVEQIHVPLLVWVPGVQSTERSVRPTSPSYVLPWLLLRGSEREREAVREVLETDVGPWMAALDGAVVSEMIGPRAQHAAFHFEDHVVVYDVLADLLRLYDARTDVRQDHDLHEERADLLGRFAPISRRYRRIRFAGRRFRFIEPMP